MNTIIPSPSKFWRWVLGAVVLAAMVSSIVYLARPSSIPTDKPGEFRVVAAENVWGNIASQLGGSHVQITSILNDPNADPHLYESNARDASSVSMADVVIVNGLGYDDFMPKLLKASNKPTRHIITAAQILNASTGANQHLWYDISGVRKVAAGITYTYITIDPSHKNDYVHNLATFNQSLQGIENTIAIIRQKYARSPVAYTEPVPGYLLTAAGLSVKTPSSFAKSIEDGDDPNPSDTTTMNKLITSRSIKVLLYNAQATSPVTESIKELAGQYGIPVIGVTETLPKTATNFQAWQQHQIMQLLNALGG